MSAADNLYQHLDPGPHEIREMLIHAHRAEVLAEATTWLIKKAREFYAVDTRRSEAQGNALAAMASKIARGAVRPNNQRMLPQPVFFEVDRTYFREHHGDRIEFHVSSVDVAPDGAKYTAFGWRRRAGQEWEPTDADDLTGWTEVTEGGAADA